jgi:ferredoxin
MNSTQGTDRKPDACVCAGHCATCGVKVLPGAYEDFQGRQYCEEHEYPDKFLTFASKKGYFSSMPLKPNKGV